MNLTLQADHLRALLTVAADSKKDPRRHLYGAHFHAGRRGVIGMATNGSMMLVAWCSAIPAPDGYWFAPGCWKVPAGIKTAELSNTGEGENLSASLTYPGGALSWHADDTHVTGNTRIEWERSVPRTVSGEPAYFDPDLLALFNKASGFLGHKVGPSIRSNGDGPALVTFADSLVFGVIMPMRKELMDSPPEWFAPALAVAA